MTVLVTLPARPLPQAVLTVSFFYVSSVV